MYFHTLKTNISIYKLSGTDQPTDSWISVAFRSLCE